MRLVVLPLALSAALLSSPTGARDSVQKVQNTPTKMVCRKWESTGTRLGNRRVCATEEQWRQRDQEDRIWMEQHQVVKRICPSFSAEC